MTAPSADPGHEAAPPTGAVVAAFDVDGTLTVRDCFVPFLVRIGGRGRLLLATAAQPRALLAAGMRLDRDRIKAVAVRGAFAGREVAEVERAGASFAAEIATMLRPDTIARLRWHRSANHRVVLVSASLGAYLRPLGRDLAVDGVLCTEVAADGAGRYTGELVDGNCRGPEKQRRLESWLREQNLDGAEVWAYGDSRGDREMLLAAERATNVRGREIGAEP